MEHLSDRHRLECGDDRTRISTSQENFDIAHDLRICLAEHVPADASAATVDDGVPGSTRSEQVFALLRVDILTGRFAPGSRLRFADLTARYGASGTVVREGLSRLAELGLVVAHPQQGFRVTPLSVSDLIDLTAARCDIEGITLRHAVLNGDLRWESDVVAATHTLERTGARMVVDRDGDRSSAVSIAWAAARRGYHVALLAGCPNLRLQAFASTMRDAAELYRAWMPPLARDQDPTVEHRAVVDAALARDAELAVELLRQHVQGMTDLMIASRIALESDLTTTAAT
jgi:DNA-binding GntR family transcriptional regulator